MDTRDSDIQEQQPAPDPRLDALLDQALGPQSVPGGIPPDLARRIVARTTPMLRRRHGILAVLGPQVRALALAACVAVAAGVGLWVYSSRPTAPPVPVPQPALAATADIDAELAMLSVRLDEVNQPGYWSFSGGDNDRTLNDLSQSVDVEDEPTF